MQDFIVVSTTSLLILAAAMFSRSKGHGLEKELLIASGRTVLQLLLLGHVLGWIFKNGSLAMTLIAAMIMTVNAAVHSKSRVRKGYPGLFLDNLVATSLAIWPLAFFGAYLMNDGAWWSSHMLLPLMGMLLGNTLTGIAMGVDQFSTHVQEKKDEVLSYLAWGASMDEATRPLFQRSLRLAMTPTINSMLSMGLVSIPGMMTGQLIAGDAPTKAAVIQIVIMLLIATGTYLGSYLGLTFSRNKLFNAQGQPCF